MKYLVYREIHGVLEFLVDRNIVTNRWWSSDIYHAKLYDREMFARERISRLKYRDGIHCCRLSKMERQYNKLLKNFFVILYKYESDESVVRVVNSQDRFSGLMSTLPYMTDTGVTSVDFISNNEFKSFSSTVSYLKDRGECLVVLLVNDVINKIK